MEHGREADRNTTKSSKAAPTNIQTDSSEDMHPSKDRKIHDKPTNVHPGKSNKPLLAKVNTGPKQYTSVLDFSEEDMKDPRLATLAFQLANKAIKEQRMQIKRLSNKNRSSREKQEPLKRIIKSVAKCKEISLDEISRYI